MINYQLKNIDPDDINDLLTKVEKSLNIKFDKSELNYIKTFGQLCDHITNKIQLQNSPHCTSQQAFYKIKKIISQTNSIHNNSITPNLLLEDLFPRNDRRNKLKNIEHQLGFKLNILRPPHWLTYLLLTLLTISLITLFFNWKIAPVGIIFSITGFYLASKFGKEFKLQTLGQVTKKITRENYLKSRTNPNTFNKSEVEEILTDLFSSDLGLDKNKFSREAKF